MCCSVRNTVVFKMWDGPVPSLLHIFLRCDNCGVLLPVGKDFLRTGQMAIPGIKVTLSDSNKPRWLVRCFLWYSPWYRDWIQTSFKTHLFLPEKQWTLIFSDTPKNTQHQTSFEVKIRGFFGYAFFVLLEKERIMYLWTILNVSQVLLPMFTLNCPIIIMQSRFGIYRGMCLLKSLHARCFCQLSETPFYQEGKVIL